MNCPLCSHDEITPFGDDHQCSRCLLVFRDSKYHLSPEDEKERYFEHTNNPKEQGYRDFLSRLKDPLVSYLNPGDMGLDYGCGPGPTLSILLKESGLECEDYDPFFFPNEELLTKSYDFLTCTEACEHFHRPGHEFKKIMGLIKTKGVLGLMTELCVKEESYNKWYYRTDPTHVCFYSLKTFDYLSSQYNLDYEQVARNAFIFKKQS